MSPECFPLHQAEETPKNENPEKEKNTVEVETLNAFYNVLFNIHNLPIREEMIPPSDAFLLEYVADYPNLLKQGFEEYLSGARERLHLSEEEYEALRQKHAIMDVQILYQNIIKRAKKERKPLFIPDINRALYNKKEMSSDKEAIIKIIEAVLGCSLVVMSVTDAAKIIKSNEPVTRREFLKKGAKIIGQLSGAAYLGAPRVAEIAIKNAAEYYMLEPTKERLGNLQKAQKTYEMIEKTNPLDSQPTFTVDTRNALIAQKAEAVAEVMEKELGRKPELSLAIGALHFGIVESLQQTSAQRMKKLKNDLGEHLAEENRIIRIDFLPDEAGENEKAKITIIEDPAFRRELSP